MYHRRFGLFAALSLAALIPAGRGAPAPGQLLVGAARVDITPATTAPMLLAGYGHPIRQANPFRAVHDPLHVRAIVVSDGTNHAALVCWELLGMPTAIWAELAPRIAERSGIPPQNLLMAGTHTHSAPVLVGIYGRSPAPTPALTAYTEQVKEAALAAVLEAKAALRPARIGFGVGEAHVNVNRRKYFPEKGWRWLGYNPDGPSDKTVAVVKFSGLDGKPIALVINYSVHAVVMGPENLSVSGDLAGEAARYVEHFYRGEIPVATGEGLDLRPEEKVDGEDPVVLWTSGAGGDQNPITRARGEDFTMVTALGRILGEESVRVASGISMAPDGTEVTAAQRVLTFPGRRVTTGHTPQREYRFEETDPVEIRLSMVRIGPIVFGGLSGEPFTLLSQRLKKRSPFPAFVLVTHANGGSGYIPTDDAYDELGYEVVTSRLRPGDAEETIIRSFIEMIEDGR